ncbi:Methyltransferase type 12 [Kitasatospora sp. MMS16-BH015]|uniref:class I SAM-dependent methyltransferase n=1 Tax=Kitasatospora sp. MMS16-BH015 TaxID=2018025 RepID=UPI000CA22206|nr:methyltransferase domain-containing protein [Kitasatospora sp. MMS16-BH015]AUG80703.1 Methyltransferase type 12 [Kitasatospora sp. MMS16-BH015]
MAAISLSTGTVLGPPGAVPSTPRRAAGAPRAASPRAAAPGWPEPGWLPGLESVAPAALATDWLQDHLLNPHSADILGYLRAARTTGGPVLDLGAGAGRLAVPFAHHGFEVEAVDRDEGCLGRLRAWALRGGRPTRHPVRTTAAELEGLRLQRGYGFVMLAGAMISAVRPAARPALLAELASNLRPGGALALDYTAHRPAGLAADPVRNWVFRVPRYGADDDMVTARQSFEPATAREEIVFHTRSRAAGLRRVHATEKWLVDPERLATDLRAAGLRISLRDSHPLDARTESVFLLCRPR